jgi:CBS domain-containing protein
MTVAKILKTKGADVVAARPGTPLIDIARLLAEHRIGAVPVIDGKKRLRGIVSERDVVRAVARSGASALEGAVDTVMTKKVVVCRPEDSIYEIMSVMTDNRIRHLPVVVDDKLVGLVSIGDVVKQRIAEVEFEASEMKRYIAG